MCFDQGVQVDCLPFFCAFKQNRYDVCLSDSSSRLLDVWQQYFEQRAVASIAASQRCFGNDSVTQIDCSREECESRCVQSKFTVCNYTRF